MYFASVILLLVVLPVVSILVEGSLSHHAMSVALIGKWFVFWGVGVRLLFAGVRQVVQPRFTAEEIFGIRDPGSFAIVREVGFANLSMGLLGVCTLFWVGWIVPAAVVGGLYYGLAGVGHVFAHNKNAKEYLAMVSDGFIFVVLLVFVFKSLLCEGNEIR
jgi:ABC-type methionine transport system permease subunit